MKNSNILYWTLLGVIPMLSSMVFYNLAPKVCQYGILVSSLYLMILTGVSLWKLLWR